MGAMEISRSSLSIKTFCSFHASMRLHLFCELLNYKDNKQTAVINITRQRMLLKLSVMDLTFRMLQHTSSEVTVTKTTIKHED